MNKKWVFFQIIVIISSAVTIYDSMVYFFLQRNYIIAKFTGSALHIIGFISVEIIILSEPFFLLLCLNLIRRKYPAHPIRNSFKVLFFAVYPVFLLALICQIVVLCSTIIKRIEQPRSVNWSFIDFNSLISLLILIPCLIYIAFSSIILLRTIRRNFIHEQNQSISSLGSL